MCVLVTSPCNSRATIWSHTTSDGTKCSPSHILWQWSCFALLFPLSAHPQNVTTFFFLPNIWFLYLLTTWLNFFELFSLSISRLKLEPSLPLRLVVKSYDWWTGETLWRKVHLCSDDEPIAGLTLCPLCPSLLTDFVRWASFFYYLFVWLHGS